MVQSISAPHTKHFSFPQGFLVDGNYGSLVRMWSHGHCEVQGRLGNHVFSSTRMANHSSIRAWRILRTEEPGGGYSPWGCKESDCELFRHPPGWTVQSSSHQVNFRVACWAPSPSHVQGRNPAGGLKQAEIFMPHPENQTSETELMPLERNRGGISGD